MADLARPARSGTGLTMATEIERKFLVAGDGWHHAVTRRSRIRQAYLCSGGNASVRVRLINEDEARLTIKSGPSTGSALMRDEFEYPVPLADGLALIALCPGRGIDKVRHLVPADAGRTWEVDVFAGPHSGLVLAEIELGSAEETVSLPGWIGREVTNDPRYGNEALARNGLPVE